MEHQKRPPQQGQEDTTRLNDEPNVLPLSSIPFETPALKKATLIKNARMETELKMFSDPLSGNLIVSPDQLPQMFPSYKTQLERDQKLLSQLSSLPSFDVYSLRVSLRKMGINVPDEQLNLSDTMRANLRKQMQSFIRPLVLKIYGDTSDSQSLDMDDLRKLLVNSDIDLARQNLQRMSEKLGMKIQDVPAFIEDYSEIFMSAAYYDHLLASIMPGTKRFFAWLKELSNDRNISQDPRLRSNVARIETTMEFIVNSLQERMAKFDHHFESFWGDINAVTFKKLKDMIRSNHADVGGVLCGLVVKIRRWEHDFPTNEVGGPQRRLDFLKLEIEPGLLHLQTLEKNARLKLGLAG